MKVYTQAQVEVILLDEMDIVRTSDNVGWLPEDGDNGWEPK